MRIGVDATCWTNRRGYGRFARALLSAALEADRENEYTFYVDEANREFPLPERVRVVHVAAGRPTVKAAAANGSRSPLDMWAMSRAASGGKHDLFFFPSVYSFVPMASRVPKIVTIHDVIPELYPKLVFPTRKSRLLWRAKVALGVAQAEVVLTVSDYSQKLLGETLGIAAGRIRVVQEASDPAFRPLENPQPTPLLERHGLVPGARFVSFVGGFSPHKNMPLLVEVFRELHAQADLSDVKLVFGGDYEGDVFYSGYQKLRRQVEQAGLESCVVFTGYLRDSDLLALMNLSQAVLLPSFCEGVGLPALEAAACGTPVVATSHSPLEGLLGQGAIILEPEDRPGWTAAVASLLREPERRRRMGRAALEAARRLSWQNSARQLLEVFREVGSRAATR
jgi:glycosyltransferase involved in cell wall biosynthesis